MKTREEWTAADASLVGLVRRLRQSVDENKTSIAYHQSEADDCQRIIDANEAEIAELLVILADRQVEVPPSDGRQFVTLGQ